MSLFAEKVLRNKRYRLRVKVIEILQITTVFVALVPLTVHHFWPKAFSAKIIISAPNSYTEQDGMPNFFYFGGDSWDITADAQKWDGWLNERNADAATICADHLIVLRSNLPRAVRVESLFHEFLHVGTCNIEYPDAKAQYYNSDSMMNHVGFERIAIVYTAIFRQNPELGRYMASDK